MSESEERNPRHHTNQAELSPLGVLRRQWKLGGVIALVITALFVVYAFVRPPVYTAEVRLAVGAGQMSTLAIPGFPTASRDLAADYARWVTNRGVGDTDVPPGTLSLTASPFAESNVIRIEATSTNSETAVAAAQGASDALMREVNKVEAENDPQLVLDEIVKAAPALAFARMGASIAQGRYQDIATKEGSSSSAAKAAFKAYATLVSEQVRLETLQNGKLDRRRVLISQQTTEADLRTIGRGALIASNDHVSGIERYGLLGLLLGGVVALGAALVLERRRSSPRSS